MLRHVSIASLFWIIPGLPLLLLILRLLKIVPRWLQARKLDLPIYISPFTWQDPLWMLIYPYFLWLRYLPFGLGKGIGLSYFGSTDLDKGRTHLEAGAAICIVSPNRLEILCNEPSVVLELMQKWKVWTKSSELYGLFNTFGENVLSVNGQDWQRHRKIASQTFREETYGLVWNESCRQARQLMQAIEQRGQPNLVSLVKDSAILAMHVLSAAVFGQSYDYGHGLQRIEPGHSLSYFASLAFVLQNMLSIILFKSLAVSDWLLPSYLRRLKLSVAEFQQYLREAQEQEKKAGMSERSGASLISALVRANEDAKDESRKTDGFAMHLSDQELYGNMYAFSMAGFETTSFALSFTTVYLAAYPEFQEWIQEEIDAVFYESREAGAYETTFNQLVRCRALIFETLRLHSVTPTVPRLSPSKQTTDLYFHSLNRTIAIPPDTYVCTNFAALNRVHPFWGPNANTYSPKRWVALTASATQDAANSTHTTSSNSGNPLGEHLIPEPHPSKVDPSSALYMPWLSGPRVCPGKKFSQVEFVAVIYSIFSMWRTEPEVVGGADSGNPDGRRLLKESLEKAVFNMTPKLYQPEKVRLRWVKREGVSNGWDW